MLEHRQREHKVTLVELPKGWQKDAINQPAHYARWPLQPIEFISINGIGYFEGNVIKYICRHDAKNGLEDLYKARSYLDMLIRKTEGHERWWEKPVAEERELNHGL